MDILQLLQTLGICVGAVALVAIAIMLFVIISTFLPGPPPEIDDLESLTVLNLDRSSRTKKRRNKKDVAPENPITREDKPAKPS